jgi:spermidine synthase
VASLGLLLVDRPLAERHPGARILHDHTATVVATHTLFVNGVPVSTPTHVTKVMTHLPLAHLEEPPTRLLVICLGVGTSFRSGLSWGIEVDVVELVPSVARVLPMYWREAPLVLSGAVPGARVVVDDGRRYLDRGDEPFDAITIDPPPPVEAAASSLLYSVEFYDSVKRRLTERGILQVWLPAEGDGQTRASITLALLESFPFVRMFDSVEEWGIYYLASRAPIPARDAASLAARLPESAALDLEALRGVPAQEIFEELLAREIDPRRFVDSQGDIEHVPLTDDRPINEYYLLRSRCVGAPCGGSARVRAHGRPLPLPLASPHPVKTSRRRCRRSPGLCFSKDVSS